MKKMGICGLRVGLACLVLAGLGCKQKAAGTGTSVAGGPAMADAGPNVDAGAEAFVRALYAHYTTDKDFSSLGDGLKGTFSPPLQAMFVGDQKKAQGVGAIDADPICQCQDPSGMKVQAIDMVGTGADTANAKVTLLFDKPVKLTLKLVKLTQGWRVDDVLSESGAGMRAALNNAKY